MGVLPDGPFPHLTPKQLQAKINKVRRKIRADLAHGKKKTDYQRRNERLSDLGYVGYKQYLQSDDWKRIRHIKLSRFPVCLLCPKPATQVHHMSYEKDVLLGLALHMLVCLCPGCHTKIEFGAPGVKLTLAEANTKLFIFSTALGLTKWTKIAKKGLRYRKFNQKKCN